MLCQMFKCMAKVFRSNRHFVRIEMVRFHVNNLRTLKWRKTTIVSDVYLGSTEFQSFNYSNRLIEWMEGKGCDRKYQKERIFFFRLIKCHSIVFALILCAWSSKKTVAMLDSLCRCHQNCSHHYYSIHSMFRLCVWPRTAFTYI